MGVGAGLYMCDVVKKFTFAISSPDEFLYKWSPKNGALKSATLAHEPFDHSAPTLQTDRTDRQTDRQTIGPIA